MVYLLWFTYKDFRRPPVWKSKISCDGSVTKNIGVDCPNFRTHGFLKKICLQTVSRSPAATKVTRNREFNPNHIILHVGTNERKSSKTASQIIDQGQLLTLHCP